MGHFISILSACVMKRKFSDYLKEKDIGLHEDKSSKGKTKAKTKKGWLANFINNIKTPKTIENTVFKSFVGFIGGILLTYIFFCFFYFGVNFSLQATTYVCGLAGIILSIGLAFSSKVRCYVLLLIPVFFSKQGRQAILAYALFLSFTGPARNTMQNMKILSDSMTCGQEVVKRTLTQIINMVKAPFKSIKDTIMKIKKSLEEVIEKVKQFVLKIKRIILLLTLSLIKHLHLLLVLPYKKILKLFIMSAFLLHSSPQSRNLLSNSSPVSTTVRIRVIGSCLIFFLTPWIVSVIKKATSWLGSIVNFCNKKIGTPFQRCMKTFEDAIVDCKAKLGVMDFLCHVVHVVKGLCYTVKWLDFICLFTEFVSEKIIGTVKKKLREFNLQMKTLFYVSIEFSHSYEFETKASNTTKEVAKTIIKKISQKVEKIQTLFSFCGFMFSFLFLFVFFKTFYYKYKYLSSDRYDNVFISNYIVELDIKRAQMDKETVLPLERKERKKYGKPTSIRLLKKEKLSITNSMFLLSLTTFKITTFLVIDYCLFWTLITIYEAGRVELDEVEKATFKIHVVGEGILANFYESLGNAFTVPENPDLRLSPLHCLPDPVEPDFDRYIRIGFLVGVCWILTATEAYGLRLRNVVMSHYYPDRARERAVWLYNHILQTRGSFVRFARRQLRRKFGLTGERPIEKVTLTQRLFAHFPLLGALFGKSKENNCLLCGAPETKTEPLKRCRTPDCSGRYCIRCFATLQNVCTICQHPIEYGDISDISEEVDSSEEDLYERNRATRHRYDSDEAKNYDKFKTFQEMESRDRFKDLEKYEIPDYVKLGDLYHDKAELQARLKDVINRHIQNIEKEIRRREEEKRKKIHRIKLKLENLTTSLKKKKTESLKAKKSDLMEDFKNKINIMKKTKNKKNDDEEALLGESSKPPKNKVTFKDVVEEDEATDYKNIKEKMREELKARKSELMEELKKNVNAMKKLESKKNGEEEELLGGSSKPSKIKVSFKGIDDEPETNYKSVKEKMKEELRVRKSELMEELKKNVNAMKKLENRKDDEEEEFPKERPKHSKTRVSFKGIDDEPKIDYKSINEKIKKQILKITKANENP